MISEDRFRDVFNTVEPLVEDRYGIPVIIRDVPDPFHGDLDGAEIYVDYALGTEEAVFNLTHLFGHTVQWNTSRSAHDLGISTADRESVVDQRLEQIVAYERQATAYSIQLLHEAGVFDLDHWLSDFSNADLAYLLHFYRTGKKRPFREFWKEGTPLIQPLRIPRFVPQKLKVRCEGVVI